MREWLLRHTPWWVATVLWCVPMLLIGTFAVTVLYGTMRLAFAAIAETDLAYVLGAVFYGYIGVLVSVWWFREAEHWREVTPRALRPRSNPR